MAVFVRAIKAVRCVDRVLLRRQLQVIRNTLLDGRYTQHDVTVMLASNAQVRRLNWWYASNRHTTDVLSFPQRAESRRKPHPPSFFQADVSTILTNSPFLDPNTGHLLDGSRAPPPHIAEDLGQIFIAVEYCHAIAKQRRINPADYIALACVHGMAHLVGFDHHTQQAYESMKNAERAAVQAVMSHAGIAGDHKRFPASYLP